jgi:hypothetical protein
MKTNHLLKRGILASAIIAIFLNVYNASATTYAWTNTAGGLWSAAANWSPNGIPGSGDTALITTSGTYAVGLSAPVTVNLLTVGTINGSGTQSFSTSTINLTVQSSLVVNNTGAFTLNGGVLTVNGTIQGLVTWTGGQFGNGPGPLTLATNATLVLAGSNGTDYSMGQFVTNAGTIELQSGNLALNYCTYYGGLQNLPGALINLEGNVSIDGCGGTGLINGGTLVKSAGSGVSAINQTFHNTGTVNVETGSLFLYGPSSDANGTYNGPGTTVITNGSFTENGTLSVSNLVLAGGNLLGNGTIHGLITWTGGLIGPGNNHITLASDGTLLLEGLNGANYTIAQVMTNAGVFRVLSGNLYINWCGSGDYGQFINLPGALVDLAGDVSISGDGCSPGLSNFGTVRKSSGTGTSAIDTAFQNQANGTLNVQSGTVVLNAPVTDNGGSYTGAGTTLITNTTLAVNAALTSSNILLAGGNLLGNGTIHGLITWTGGLIGPGNNHITLASDGTLLLEGLNGTNYTIAQVMTNAGVIRVLSGNLSLTYCGGGNYGQLINLTGALVDLAGDVSISGDSCSPGLSNAGIVRKSSGTGTSAIDTAFQNQANGILDIQTGSVAMGAPFIFGSGTLQFVISSANNYTKLSLSSAATFGGLLSASLTNGYAPTNGTIYNLISYPSATGAFTAEQLPLGLFWQQIYGNTNYALRVVTGPIFVGASVSGTNAVFTGTDGMANGNYVVLTSTNVAQSLTNWTVLSTNSFDGGGGFRFTNEINPATTQQFFIIRAP